MITRAGNACSPELPPRKVVLCEQESQGNQVYLIRPGEVAMPLLQAVVQVL